MSEHYLAKTETQKKTEAHFESAGKSYRYYSLPKLAQTLGIDLETLPISIRIVLESVLRNADGTAITDNEIKTLAMWNATNPAEEEIPFTVARIVLQDFTGVPLLVDLAAMRTAMSKLGKNPKAIEPLVPVDLVVDHSVQVDFSGDVNAYTQNLKVEFERNQERYEFLKWGQDAFETFKVIPPGVGIIHQVNLEYLARGVIKKGDMVYPDTLVGTDSHTTMINGLGVVGWGVGGIEAEAGMLGQPLYFLTPEVVGMELSGKLREGVTATDMTLTITQILRKEKVVGKFVEFFGEGAASLTLADRATIANMAPEYGATMGFFGVDDETLRYLEDTGRSSENVQLVRDYYKAQNLFGIPAGNSKVKYSKTITLDLNSIEPSVAGPKRPQDRVVLKELGRSFAQLFSQDKAEGGFGKKAELLNGQTVLLKDAAARGFGKLEGQCIRNGSVLIAAITSCTNTSNPSVMVAAGLLAQKAVARGLTIAPSVKTSLAPGSRVVTDYLEKAGLQVALDKLGFNLVGYGCTTCIGNSGPLAAPIEAAITEGDLVAASVLSGNRNFEARVHPAIKANYLMSPPLVVAFAIAGRVDINLETDPLGKDQSGKDVFLKDVWPTQSEVRNVLSANLKADSFMRLYKGVDKSNPDWNAIETVKGDLYDWKDESTYIQEPPFFDNFGLQPGSVSNIKNARALLLLGDSVTTDHISPAGSFKASTPAGKFLTDAGVAVVDFNSYGSRRGNDRIMTRGTFANVRIKNLMLGGEEGGYTLNLSSPGKEKVSVYDAAQAYRTAGIPLVVIGGKEYGTGSSRDWAAKGTQLLGVKAVITESFERIHRSNLVGMGVLPLCFEDGQSAQTLGLDGTEEFSILGIEAGLKPRQKLEVVATKNGKSSTFQVTCRIDTPIEVEYYKHGGILPYVLRQIAAK